MAILFLPNDPLVAPLLPVRQQPPRPDPPATQAGFSYTAEVTEGIYSLDSVEFRFWQCREAALATLETWATLAPPLGLWQNGQLTLPLQHDAGIGLEAHYTRTAVQFWSWETPARN